MGAIHGTQQLRVNWKNTKRLIDAIIDKGCLSNFTWKGKGKDNKNTKEAFDKLHSIHELLIFVLKTNDKSYNFELFKAGMVKNILSRAYTNS